MKKTVPRRTFSGGPNKRAAYAAIHNVLSSSAIFCGALLGGLLSTVIPADVSLFGRTMHWTSSLWGVLLISSVARALMALALYSAVARSARRASAQRQRADLPGDPLHPVRGHDV